MVGPLRGARCNRRGVVVPNWCGVRCRCCRPGLRVRGRAQLVVMAARRVRPARDGPCWRGGHQCDGRGATVVSPTRTRGKAALGICRGSHHSTSAGRVVLPRWRLGLRGSLLRTPHARGDVVCLSPLYLQRPIAMMFVVGAVLLDQFVFPSVPAMAWFVPVFFVKLLISHLLKEAPYSDRQQPRCAVVADQTLNPSGKDGRDC